MFTIAAWRSTEILKAWPASAARLPLRTFYYFDQWLMDLNSLPGPSKGGLIRLTSPRGRVQSLVTRFVDGVPKGQMVLPQGDASNPMFKRLDPPNQAVVEMRTTATRSFGFVHSRNCYVAVRLGPIETVKDRKSKIDPYTPYIEFVRKVLRRTNPTDWDGETDVEELITDVSSG